MIPKRQWCKRSRPRVYTATMTGQDGGTGVGLLEIYEGDQSLGNRIREFECARFCRHGR